MSKFSYPTPDALSEAVDEYFAKVKRTRGKPTVAGLALHLGFPNQEALDDYAQRLEFECDVVMAKQRIEADLTRRLLDFPDDTHAIMTRLVTDHGWRWPEGCESDLSCADVGRGGELEVGR